MKVINKAGDSEKLYTKELNDILTSTPNFLIRWGIGFFLLVIIAFIGEAMIIKYPIKAQVKVTIQCNDCVVLYSTIGQLNKVLVEPYQSVKIGQPLAIFNDHGDHNKIMELLDSLTALQNSIAERRTNIQFDFAKFQVNKLGRVAIYYKNFVLSYNSTKNIDQGYRHLVFIHDLNTLILKVNEWIEQNVIISPINGQVVFSRELYPSQPFKLKEQVFYVVPYSTHLSGTLHLSPRQLSNIKEGQKYNLEWNCNGNKSIVNVVVTSVMRLTELNSASYAKIKFPPITALKDLPTNLLIDQSFQCFIMLSDESLFEHLFNTTFKMTGHGK